MIEILTWWQTALALLNLAICAVIAWSSICRLAMMDARTTRMRFRLSYSVVLVSSVSSGASPVLWGEMPGLGQIGMAVSICYLLGAGYGSWRGGVPGYATRPGVLHAVT